MATSTTAAPGTAPIVATTTDPNSGRYRVLITGFAATKQTVDDPRNYDGIGDEVYAAAAVVVWDRTQSTILFRNFLQTLTYGDTAVAVPAGTRIKAGSASPTGGIWGGNGNEFVPSEFNPTSTNLPTPMLDRFPLLVWEGTLTNNLHGLLIVPSLWESDLKDDAFKNYKTNWTTAPVTLLGTPTVQNQLLTSTVTSAVVPQDIAYETASELTTFFTGGLVGGYGFVSGLVFANTDRPIGLLHGGNVLDYQDRLVVITREKLQSLAVGAGITVAVPFAEPMDGALNGLYTLYLRVVRTQ